MIPQEPNDAARTTGAGVPTGTPRTVTFREAFAFWLKLGFISFGGPAGQIAVMHAELVERKRWISEKRFLHALNYCMVLPGPEAQQLATYVGWLLHRTLGGLVAGALFVLPSLLILIALAWVYLVFGDVPAVAGVLYGIKPAVTAIVLHAAWRIGTRALGNAALVAIAAAAFVAIFAFDVPFPAIVAGAALLGALGARWRPAWFAAGGGHGAGGKAASGPAVIDDDTPTPAHARFRWTRLATVLGIGVVAWAVPIAALAAAFGWHGTLTQMAWFFTKAALVTFGGAYAVLPYVVQGAVERYGWATPAQMIDGLALGETTPGPLIMVVAFVGFVGGWQSEELRGIFGGDGAFLAGAAAATVVTWFTFLPSFVFILAGGPLVEATHDMHQLTAPLRAITAAVVGVIVNLALFFAAHVLWPGGGAFDVVAAAITVAAAVALFVFKRGVVTTILVAGGLGLLLRFAAPQWLPSPDAPAAARGSAAATTRAAPAPDLPVFESPRFRLTTSATPAQTERVAADVEALASAWHAATGIAAVPDAPRHAVRLYGTRGEFRAENRSRAWAEAYYVGGTSYAYWPDHGANRTHWALHEVVHQLNAEVGCYTLRRWLDEGLATYLASSRIVDGALQPGAIDPDAYPIRWLDTLGLTGDAARDAAEGRFIPLGDLLDGTGPPLDRTVNLHYVHWWSLVHFLMHADDGRHAPAVRALLAEGGSRAAFERLVGPVAEIEPRWHAYLRARAAAIAGRSTETRDAIEVTL